MAKYRTYQYEPINPEKYSGSERSITLRSSWELEFARHCDLLPSVIGWGYEIVAIPYRDPITNTQKTYTPDFFVDIAQTAGHSEQYVFEIKPMHEQLQEHARNRKDAALVARNAAKWGAATKWADRHSATFAVLNEKDLYGWHEARKPRINPIKTFSQTHSSAVQAPAKPPGSVSKPRPVSSRGRRVMSARSTVRRGSTPRVSRIRKAKKS